jgi:hypothetical protein
VYRMSGHLSFPHIRPLFLIVIVLLSLMTYLVGVSVPTAAQGEVLLDDSFGDNNNNWEPATDKDSTFAISDGVLTMEMTKAGVINFATPESTFPDNIEVQVEATTPEPPTTGNWYSAIIIRADARTTASGFYQFHVTGKGEWAFVTRTTSGKDYKVQKTGKLRNFDAAAPVNMKVVADGNIFSFTVNETKVGTFEDDTINNDPSTEKHVGLLIGTMTGTDYAKVEFRNFVVTALEGTDIDATPTPTRRVATTTRRSPTPVRRTATRPPPTQAASGDILLDDNFDLSNPNEWVVGPATNGRKTITKNTLVVEVLKASVTQITWPRAHRFPADVDVSVNVKATNPHSSGSWTYGIGVRDHTKDNERHIYFFEILGSGNYQFVYYNSQSNPAFRVVKREKISGVTFDAKAENTLRFVAVGNHFEFYLNDVKVGEADDDTVEPPAESNIVLDAATGSQVPTLKVTFSNFIVKSAG